MSYIKLYEYITAMPQRRYLHNRLLDSPDTGTAGLNPTQKMDVCVCECVCVCVIFVLFFV